MVMFTYSLHKFTAHQFEENEMPFRPADYSYLKFGSDVVAKKFGYELADGIYSSLADMFHTDKRVVVLPSPYNCVPNAAMVMCGHFIDRLNHLVTMDGGQTVEFSYIRRKLNFTVDYGFLSHKERMELLTRDEMYVNSSFVQGKTVLFLDDVRITGTNEHCMKSVIDKFGMNHEDCAFVYFAALAGESSPEIEARLNLNAVNTLAEYRDLMDTPNHHIIVRPIKFILGRSEEEFETFIHSCDADKLRKIYHGAISEGYHMAENFAANFMRLREFIT